MASHSEKVKHETNPVASILETARETAEDVATKVSSKARDVASDAKGYATDAVEGVNSMINENPLQALLVGFGVGCLVGVVATSLVKR